MLNLKSRYLAAIANSHSAVNLVVKHRSEVVNANYRNDFFPLCHSVACVTHEARSFQSRSRQQHSVSETVRVEAGTML